MRYNSIKYFKCAEEKRYLIYIFTALYHEAHCFISYYNLKRDAADTRFQVFCSEDGEICLTVTGAGEIAAAAAVASICTGRQPGRGDFLINIGICAAAGGQIFLCNKITEQETGRTFYPDMLYQHDFAEGCVITGRNLWMRQAGTEESVCGMQIRKHIESAVGEDCAEIRNLSDGLQQVLYDMEAAAIYQAGAYFFAPHQMSFLKIVSDDGNADGVSPERVEHLMEENTEKIVSYIGTLHRAGEREREVGKDRTFPGLLPKTAEDEADMSDRLCADLHCTAVMRVSVQQHLRYCELSGTDYIGVVRRMYEDGRLPCRDKREGKMRFEELKRELL